jgi:hypothetical protein
MSSKPDINMGTLKHIGKYTKKIIDVSACGVTLAQYIDLMYHSYLNLPYQNHIRTGNIGIDLGLTLLTIYGTGLVSWAILKSFYKTCLSPSVNTRADPR